MTFIRPQNQSYIFLNIVIVFFICTVVSGALYLIMIYSRTTSLAFDIDRLQMKIKAVQTASAELQSSMFTKFDHQSLEDLAVSRGFVQEKNPEYVQVGGQWAFASQY